MKKSSVFFAASIGFASALAFGLGMTVSQNPPPANGAIEVAVPSTPTGKSGGNLKIRDLDEVWKRLQNGYYDQKKIDFSQLELYAVKGFVEGIQDPYTVFMTPDEAKDFESGLEGQLEGIGAELEVKNGKLTVISPLKNSPAEQAGIRPGDIILKIGEEFAEDMKLFDAIRKIRGKKGTKVTLTLFRETRPEPFTLTITRSEIQLESLVLKKLEGDIFHLAIYQFSDHTKQEFENAVQKILLERARGLVLDLRGNGGGYLDIAVEILSEFLKGKKTAVIIKKKNAAQNEKIQTNGNARLADILLVILVDKGSASASEIVAGAVQDYKQGIIAGETSFGKGSVQELSELPDGSELRMTIAKWFTPLDRTIDGVGVTPDREVKLTEEDIAAKRDPQLEEAIKLLKNRTAR